MLREGLFGGGAAISAGTQTVNAGTVIFSNQNGVTFGLSTSPGNPATLTATVNPGPAAGIGGNIAGTQTQTSGSLSFANSNNISFGLSNSSVLTASFAQSAQTQPAGNIAGIGTTFAGTNISGSLTMNSNGLNMALSGPNETGVGISAQGSSQAAGTIIFSNANGVSFGMNGSTLTGSVAAAGGAQTGISGIQVSNTTYSSGTITFQNANGITFGSSGANGISASYNSTQFAGNGTTFNGVNVSGSMTLNSAGLNLSLSGGAGGGATTGAGYLAGNTTGQSSSSTYPISSLNLSGAGIISLGWSSNILIVSGPGTTGLTQLSAGISTGGNTAGTTGLASAQLVLAGGNNITLSGSTNGGSMTVSISAGASGGLGAVQVSNTTYTSGTVSFQNANGISFGSSGANGISASYTVPTVPALSMGVSTGGNTSGNTGIYSGQVVFAGGNNITLSVSSGAGGAQTISISGANAAGAQTGISGLVVSNTTYTSGTVTFQNANGISFGSSGANGISASYTVPAQISTIGLYALGNTTQNSSTTLNQSALSFNALGAMTMGYSNGSIQASAPATSSISGTGQVSIVVNGSTISIGVPNQVTNTDFYAPYEDIQLAPVQIGQGSLIFDPQPFPNVQFDRILFNIYNTNSSLSSGSHSLSFYFGLYSRNASTLSLVGSTSVSTAVTQSGTLGSYSLYSGIRGISIGSTTTLSSGNYWMAFGSRTSSGGADGSYSNMALNGGFFTDALLSGTLSYGGYFGSVVNATNQVALGQGFYTATSTGIPASVAFSQINGTASNAGNMQGLIFASSTV
jgi:hypothetical protein